MLASIPIPSANTNSSNTQMMTSRRYFSHQQIDWPLNEIEENMMTLATCSQINNQKKAAAVAQLASNSWQKHTTIRTSAVVRCVTCQRKFHSQGNLANHQQLYQH
ncbi:unnamed protein product [Mucor hiemalis]